MRKFLLSVFVALTIPFIAMAENYPVTFDKGQDYTYNGRRLNSVSLGTQTLRLPTPLKVYSNIEDACFTAKAGETLIPSFGYTGDWMHGFVYIDFGRDGAFNVTLNSDGTLAEGCDAVAFSYAEPALGSGIGYNSNGTQLSNANVLNPPAFTLPADIAPGFYLMRYKVDWASIDPAGRPEDGNGIIKNGGAICDVRLNVYNDNGTLGVIAENGALLATDGSQLPSVVSFGEPLAMKVVASEGYSLDYIKVLHGHNLDGEKEINGVAQYSESLLPAYMMDGDIITVPAEYVDGDVKITAVFVKKQSDDTGKDYALSFDKGVVATKEHDIEIGVNNNSIKIEGNMVYYDFTLNPLLLSATRNLSLDVAGIEGKDAYLYIDLNNDGCFTVMLNENGLPSVSSELVLFSCYNGVDSNGDVAENGVIGSLPIYKLGEQLPDGVYRARLKLDNNNVNPAGSENIVAENGLVVDFLINLVSGNKSLCLHTVNGSIDGENYSALPVELTPGQGFTAVLRGAPGFTCNEVVIRHGHNLDKEQMLSGNMQWREDVLQVVDGKVVIDASLVDGDVTLFAEFLRDADTEWELVFSDEFNAEDMSQPVDEKWMRCQRYGATWNRWLSDSKEVVYLQGGDLVTRAIPNPDTANDPVPMITGGIKSNGRFGFTYGYVEARLFTNLWTGHFPAFWMMPEDQSAGWPDCGEIDIWEAIDNQNTTYHTVHSNWTYDLGYKNNPKSSFTATVPYDRYHTFGLMWDETSLTWYVDGKEVGKYNKSTIQSNLDNGQWPFDKHFHLILNQSVGNGSWAANADVTHTYETRFDWVRVYQKRGMSNTYGTVGVASVVADDNAIVNVCDYGVEVIMKNPAKVSVYDLSGREIIGALIGERHCFVLQKGTYIVCGKKVVIR